MSEIDYPAVLADLERRRDELDAAINAIRYIVGSPSVDTPMPYVGPKSTTTLVDPIQPPKSHTFFNMGIGDAAKKYLGMAKEPKRAKDIAIALKRGGLINASPNFAATVSTTLRRERKAGEVVQLPDKTWGLAGWFPSGPKQRAKTNGEAPPGSESADPSEPSQPGEQSQTSALSA